jgi:predicted pyridoxine 5'-phosphate oxidase superfamily flavin-nucleotide-binding protein
LTLARHRFAMKLSQQMQRVVREQRLGFVATVTPDGRPNLSPKGTTKLWDDERLFFADIASPGTVANLATNPHVEINVVDPILRKGFRFKGTATVYTSGEMYDRGLQILRDEGSMAKRERVRSIVVIDVTEAAELVSPAYDDGATEQSISESWLGYYNELHGLELPRT